jgi:hypothetical protein
MKQQRFRCARAVTLAMSVGVAGFLLMPLPASAQEFFVKPVAEKKVTAIPGGPLYWLVETFPTLDAAKTAAGALSLAVDVAGKAWLLTLTRKDNAAAPLAASRGGTKVAEVGPVPPLTAPVYLLRINHAGGPPGSETPPHTHPGSEAFYVLSGRLGQKTPHGVSYADAGQTMNGHQAGMPMVVFNAGKTDLSQLVMFVVDATRPFSSPAKF